MKTESFRAQLADYVLSGHAFLHCPTTEKTRLIAELKALAESLPEDGRKVFTWSHATGWHDADGNAAKSASGAEFGQPDPQTVPQQILDLPENAIFVLKDYGFYVQHKTYSYADVVIAWLLEVRDALAATGRTVIFLGPDFGVPPALANDVTTVEFPLPDAVVNAHFVPWSHVQTVIEQLEALRTEFDGATQQFIADYATLRTEWQAQHPEIPDACYPLPMALPAKFGLSWHAFKVTGAPELTAVEDIEMELEQRRARDEQVQLMEANLRRECQQFVTEYVLSFRREVAEFCDQVIAQKGAVHGKTLNTIRDRIDRFHAMNVFGDGDAAAKLTQLKQQVAGLTGQDLAQQPAVAAKLGEACLALKKHILNPDSVSQLTGRLRRRVVLD